MSIAETPLEMQSPLTVVEAELPLDQETVTVMVDAEWYVASGAEALAALLDLPIREVHHAPIGAVIHMDDITHSPLELWRTGDEVVLRFRHRTHGYVRIAVSVSPSRWLVDCWNLRLRAVEADILELAYGGTGFGPLTQQGEYRATEFLSLL